MIYRYMAFSVALLLSASAYKPAQADWSYYNSQGVQQEKPFTFKDLAGTIPHDVKEVVEFLKDGDKFKEIGAEVPRGILLVGPPGTGKTSIARAIAGEIGANFFHQAGSNVMGNYVGDAPACIRNLFSKARASTRNGAYSKAVVFIDEIDAIGGSRGNQTDAASLEYRNVLNELLNQMDGFERDDSIIVMAATNTPDSLDAALKRAGRFDRIVTVPLPDYPSREAILLHYVKKIKHDPQINFKKLALATQGLNSADLKNLVNEAAIIAVRNNSKIATGQHFDIVLKTYLERKRQHA